MRVDANKFGGSARSVVAIGECMIELSRVGGGLWKQGVAGDAYNTSVYLRRLGTDVAFMTAIGDDEFSEDIRKMWDMEKIDQSLALVDPTRTPGLYAIRTDSEGERRFSYWRNNSAARRLFVLPGAIEAMAKAQLAAFLYVSGITLSIFDEPSRLNINAIATAVRSRGGRVAFDSNFRPAGWESPNSAVDAIMRFSRFVTLAMPTFVDEQLLFGDNDPDATIDRWCRWGASEVVVKLGSSGCRVYADGRRETVAAQAVRAIDTTGAGDAFNAAYIASRNRGHPATVAAKFANVVAAQVVQQKGAIIPESALPTL